jgi:hypothetical protein
MNEQLLQLVVQYVAPRAPECRLRLVEDLVATTHEVVTSVCDDIDEDTLVESLVNIVSEAYGHIAVESSLDAMVYSLIIPAMIEARF